MLDSFFYKTRLFLCFSVLFIVFPSCQKSKSDELKILDSFLQQSHTFNTKRLNRYAGEYMETVKRFPQIDTEKFSVIASTYEQLISKIDRIIISEKPNIELLVQEYNEFLIDVKNVLATYYKRKLDAYIQKTNNLNFNTEYRLKAMKNNLMLSMVYTYQSGNGNLTSLRGCGLKVIRVKTILDQYENLTKIILTSSFIQTLKEEKDIAIDKIVFNGIDTKIKYNITENHDFTDIILDSLTTGTYQIEGTVQYFNRNGKTVIPFREEFEVH